jgi:hypothetical protein
LYGDDGRKEDDANSGACARSYQTAIRLKGKTTTLGCEVLSDKKKSHTHARKAIPIGIKRKEYVHMLNE